MVLVYNGYEDSSVEKEDLIEDLKLFKAVCDNIKHTLSKIKNYSKVTLMSDPKASYFTIVDAVLSGPREISPDALMSILGVSFIVLGLYSTCSIANNYTPSL